MKRLPLILLLLMPFSVMAQTTATVSGVRAAQRAGTKLVDVYYNLSVAGPAIVEVAISGDGGVTYDLPATSLSGDVGEWVVGGANKYLVWDAGQDWNEQYSELVKFQISASEMADEFSSIPGGAFTMGLTSGDEHYDAPPITVAVSQFSIAVTETAKARWDAIRVWGLANGYSDLPEGIGRAASHPVVGLDWYAVVKWCNARSEMEGLTPCYYEDEAHATIYGASLFRVELKAERGWGLAGLKQA